MATSTLGADGQDGHDPIVTQLEDGIARITLNRPDKRNALDSQAWAALAEALLVVRRAGARVLIVRGAGEHFCAGADVRAKRAEQHPLHRMRAITEVIRMLFEAPLPTIAAVDGYAVGAGWNLALACDFVISTDRARFSQIFATRGLSVDCGGSWLLPRLVGVQTAKRLIYTAEVIDAAEAQRLGLTLRTCVPAEFDATVDEFANRLRSAAPVALAQDKELIDGAFGRSFGEQLLRENAAQAVNFATDAPAARAAIEDKTAPSFEGRWQL